MDVVSTVNEMLGVLVTLALALLILPLSAAWERRSARRRAGIARGEPVAYRRQSDGNLRARRVTV